MGVDMHPLKTLVQPSPRHITSNSHPTTMKLSILFIIRSIAAAAILSPSIRFTPLEGEQPIHSSVFSDVHIDTHSQTTIIAIATTSQVVRCW
jgi:hypothetical protein